MPSLLSIVGLNFIYMVRLEILNIYTVNELLQRGAKQKDREEIAQQIWVSEEVLNDWVNQSDLLRIDGLQTEQLRLLRNCGINSLSALAKGEPFQLYAQAEKVRKSQSDKESALNLKELMNWVKQAQQLPPIMVD